MCGRFTFSTDLSVLVERFGAQPDPDVVQSFNAAPTQRLPVILDAEPGRMQLLRWGLVPRWAKDPTIGNRMINARAETIAEKPAFRPLVRGRRCLVIADSFYEWKRGPQGNQPFRIMLESGAPFAFAGLWDEWIPPVGEAMRTFTIITTTPNGFMKSYHHRMPVILDRDMEPLWLATSTPLSEVLGMLVPREELALRAYPVSTQVNAPINNSEDLLLPLV